MLRYVSMLCKVCMSCMYVCTLCMYVCMICWLCLSVCTLRYVCMLRYLICECMIYLSECYAMYVCSDMYACSIRLWYIMYVCVYVCMLCVFSRVCVYVLYVSLRVDRVTYARM